MYAGGRLLQETYGSVTLDFTYGVNGTADPVTYYYITNLQNNVLYMVTASGTKPAF